MERGGREDRNDIFKTLENFISRHLEPETIWGNLQRFNTNPQRHLCRSLELPEESRELLSAKDIPPTKKNESPIVTLGDSPKHPGQFGKFPRPHYPE